MPVRFTCPHCDYTSLVDDRYVGQSGACASCGKVIFVEAPQETPTDRHAQAQPRQRQSASGAVIVLLLTLAGIGLLVAFVVGLVFMAVPATRIVQSNAAQQNCAANLVKIGQAMLQYHDEHGRFPPAYVAGASGKPMHSWRVLLLPYLGHHTLFQQYNMSQPYDHWENQQIATQMPAVYHCPDDLGVATSETSYVFVSGNGMIVNKTESASLTQIKDGPAGTILLVEAPGISINWLEPRDLNRASLSLTLNSGTGNEIGSYHAAGGAHVLTADGKVHFLPDLTPPQVIEAMLTIDGGDDVQP